MVRYIEQKVADDYYYYDTHPTAEDLMSEAAVHAFLIRYLIDVLITLFGEQVCAVHDNLGIYQTNDPKEHPLAPDITVIKGTPFQFVPHWRIPPTGIVPQVVFEIASKETWKIDLEEKSAKYAQMGVEEYFAYDPHDPPVYKKMAYQLYGWSLDKEHGQMREMLPGPDGRLWSDQLQSVLVPAKAYLRLFDRNGHLRLTQAEAEAGRAIAEAEARRFADRRAEVETKRAEIEAEARQAADRRAEIEAEARQTADRRAETEVEARQTADRRAETEAEARQAADRRAEVETKRAETEAEARQAETKRAEAEAEARQAADRRAEALAEKLRSLGIDPDQEGL